MTNNDYSQIGWCAKEANPISVAPESYADLLVQCRSSLVESILASWEKSIEGISSDYSVPIVDVERQVALHIPSLNIETLRESSGTMPALLCNSVRNRIDRYSAVFEHFRKASYITTFDSETDIRAECGESLECLKLVRLSDNKSKMACLREVERGESTAIESELHYLQSVRLSPGLSLGLYLEDSAFPYIYAKVDRCDRLYLQDAVSLCLGEKIDMKKIFVVSRVFGFGPRPANTISMMMSMLSRRISQLGGGFIVTAINPMIGFRGRSLLASGYTPFALCPVSYAYSTSGEYKTRRQGGRLDSAKLETPPNLLFIKAIATCNAKLKRRRGIVNIDKDAHSYGALSVNELMSNGSITLENLKRIRLHLETAWTDKTRYHRTQMSKRDPISKGQCGVTSAFLAKELESKGISVKFCEGDVFFSDATPPIKQHCWLRISDTKAFGGEVGSDPEQGYIVDLTADQTGFNVPVVCDKLNNLRQKGLQYSEKSAVNPYTIKVGHLWERLNRLEQELKVPNAGADQFAPDLN